MIADNLVGHGFQSPQAMSLTHDSNIFFSSWYLWTDGAVEGGGGVEEGGVARSSQNKPQLSLAPKQRRVIMRGSVQ